ncbi:MAG: TetR/AcrR family transcriptional regulator [Erysipelotrichaceae bacterium]|nr:TetR/AcrR family transcriptional regulator [Erysipelotrichaceae bacterium]MDY5253018.1 TetR/AcrR family transcriptional regulator [Erysipelotrichaceae bacterium]
MNKVQYKQEQKRKEIALKAIPLIDKFGFNRISVSDLCKDIGLSIGSFYHYFNDKNDIIREIFKLIDSYFSQEASVDIEKHDNCLLKLRLFCFYYAFYCQNCGFEVCRQISIIPIMKHEEKFISESRFLYQMLFDIVEKGQESKEITEGYTCKNITIMLLNMIRGFCADWCRNNGSYDIVEMIDMNAILYIRQLSNDQDKCDEAINFTLPLNMEFDWLSI